MFGGYNFLDPKLHMFDVLVLALYFYCFYLDTSQPTSVKHGASLYLKFEGLNLSVVIISKTFHWLKNFESCSVISVARRQYCFASEK